MQSAAFTNRLYFCTPTVCKKINWESEPCDAVWHIPRGEGGHTKPQEKSHPVFSFLSSESPLLAGTDRKKVAYMGAGVEEVNGTHSPGVAHPVHCEELDDLARSWDCVRPFWSTYVFWNYWLTPLRTELTYSTKGFGANGAVGMCTVGKASIWKLTECFIFHAPWKQQSLIQLQK